MRFTRRTIDNIILIAGVIFLLWLLWLPSPRPDWHYFDTIKYASATLKGKTPFSDFAAMVVGFRGLYHNTDPYPILETALKELGIEWAVIHASNHPPTSYLLAAPVALFSWPIASALWAWLMLCLITFSYRFYGLSWKMSIGLTPLTMLWPPASASLGQVTVVWMFGIAMAYCFRKNRLFWSGAALGLASLSKYMPALLIIVFLLRKKWRAVLGFISLWLVAIGIASLMNASAIPRYLEANKNTYFFLMQRTDNSAPLTVSYTHGGWFGIALFIIFLALVVYVNRRYFFETNDYPSSRLWMLMSYFAVVCLPIFWIYSLLPLLPVIVYLIYQRNIATSLISLYALIISSVYIRGGEESAPFIASATVLVGLAFILDQLPMSLFKQKWTPRISNGVKSG